jgi:hypothetical protein
VWKGRLIPTELHHGRIRFRVCKNARSRFDLQG